MRTSWTKDQRNPTMYILRIFRAFHYPTSFVAKILGTSEMTDLSYSKYCVCKTIYRKSLKWLNRNETTLRSQVIKYFRISLRLQSTITKETIAASVWYYLLPICVHKKRSNSSIFCGVSHLILKHHKFKIYFMDLISILFGVLYT